MATDLLARELPTAAGKAADTPPVLMPAQQRWVADTSPLKVIEKSRRVGLTWAEAADDVAIAASSRAAGGMNVYYIGYNMDMAVEFIDACAMWARVLNLVAEDIVEGSEVFKSPDGDKEIKTYTIRFPKSGFRIQALSSRPANMRGKQGVVIIDEAAFHDQLDQLLKAALALLIWGGRVRVISTHNGDTNPFNELIQDIRAGKRKGSVHRITFREAVAEGLYARVCMRLRKPCVPEEQTLWVDDVYRYYASAAEEELDVVPSAGEGAALPRAWIEACMIDDVPVLRWSQRNDYTLQPEAVRVRTCRDWCEEVLAPALDGIRANIKHFFGSDFGRVGDLSIIWPFAEESDLRLTTPFVVELRNIPYEQQRQVLFFLVDRLRRFVSGAMDARGNGGFLAEVAAQQYGALRIAQVQTSEQWYRDNMPRLVSRFQDRTIAIPRDSDLLDDLRQLRKVKGVIKVPETARTRGADGGQRHGDGAIACAMGVFANATMDVSPIEYESTGVRASGSLGALMMDTLEAPTTSMGFGTIGGNNDFGDY